MTTDEDDDGRGTRRHSLVEYLVIGSGLVVALSFDLLTPLDLLASGVLAAATVLVATVVVVPGAWPAMYRKTGVGVAGWALWLAVAGGGLGLAYLVGDPDPFREGFVSYRPRITPFGLASAVFLGGSIGLVIAAGHLNRYRRLRNATPTPAAEAREGLIAVEGVVEPAGRPVTGPVSGEPTAWYRRVSEREILFEAHRELYRETGGGAFYVADGSGRLLVLPGGLDDHDVAELADERTEEADGHRLREWGYRPGDEATVVGRVFDVARAEYPEPVAVGLDGPVVVGTGTLADLRRWAARRVLLGAAFSLVVGGVSFAVVLLTA